MKKMSKRELRAEVARLEETVDRVVAKLEATFVEIETERAQHREQLALAHGETAAARRAFDAIRSALEATVGQAAEEIRASASARREAKRLERVVDRLLVARAFGEAADETRVGARPSELPS